MFRVDLNYFISTVLLFITEVLIALFVEDNFVRPYLGDVLVVFLMYCFIRTFLKIAVLPVVVFVLLFSFTIEFLQYFNFVAIIGLEKSRLARTVLGASFSWQDLAAYTIGAILIVVTEKYFINRRHKTS